MLHTKFQASEPNGSEEDVSFYFPTCFMVETPAPPGGAILSPETII